MGLAFTKLRYKLMSNVIKGRYVKFYFRFINKIEDIFTVFKQNYICYTPLYAWHSNFIKSDQTYLS